MLGALAALGRFCHAPLGLGALLGTTQMQCVRTAVTKTKKKKKKKEPYVVPPDINGTYVLKRKYPLRLHKVGNMPRKLTHRNFVYEVEEVKQLTDPVKVILRDVILDVGIQGQVVEVPPLYAHEDLLLTGRAVYATKENLERYAVDVHDSFSSVSAYFTQKRLSELVLNVDMSSDTPWELEKWHVRSAFRRAGVWLTDDCLSLPSHTIKGPDLSNQDSTFTVTVTINKREETPVQAKIRLHSNSVMSS